MTRRGSTRRGVLAGAAGVVATSLLAGCGARKRASLEPHLPEASLKEAGWTQVGNHEDRIQGEVPVGGSTRQVRVHAKADVYENPAPRRRLATEFGVDPGEVEVPAAAFVAAKGRPDPPVTRLFALSESLMDRVLDEGERRAKAQLRRAGFSDIRRTKAGTLSVKTGQTAAHRRYRATYEYEEREVEYRGQPVTLEPGSFTVEAQLAVWPYRDVIASGAGVYPGETGSVTVAARRRKRELSTEFEPETYRADVRDLITVVS